MTAALGLTLTAEGGEIAVYSENATRLHVSLFDAAERETRIPMIARGDGVHEAKLPGLKEGALYGLRAEGPFEPGRGHRFDVSKLIVDPYAVEIDRPFRLHPSQFQFGADTAAVMPKCVARAVAAASPGFARVAWEDTIIYELNVAGLTGLADYLPEARRGRISGLVEPTILAHFKSLGVTTLELMPCDAVVDERHLPPLGLANSWGYNPVLVGCPDPQLAPGGFAEVLETTDALHAAGFEVVLDVVLNHDGESDEFGPTLSLRGLDNALYFRLDPTDPARYINDMGCGNCLALDREPVAAMALAALKRWMVLGGVDGFRFDLATAIGRRPTGFDPGAPLFQALAADPVLNKAKLIAEPWDIGPGGYQLGQFPPGWGEWNDRFRDTARRFWRGDARARGELATRLAGSRDVFGAAPPTKSVNFVVAHDGFTLADVVSYVHKHNEANGEGNRDGTNENYSWNHGVEGPTEIPEILSRRRRDQLNLLALNIFARGVPMLAMGAETGHSQLGNNNAYAQANAISWIDWRRETPILAPFIARCLALRRAHPALRPLAWITGATLGEGIADVVWRDADGPLASYEQWNAEPGDTFVAVFTARTENGLERVGLAFNRSGSKRVFTLPTPRAGFAWRVKLDTANDEIVDAPTELADLVEVGVRATLLVAEERATPRSRPTERELIDTLAAAAGIAPEWWEVTGKQTVVSPRTKLELLDAMRLPARSQGQARASLARLMEARTRRLPASLTLALALQGRRAAPLRAAVGEPGRDFDYQIELENGEALAAKAVLGEARRVELADGREIVERPLLLPELPVGRHRLVVDGVECRLTIAPPECFSPHAAPWRRFGLSTQLYALRRASGDQGVGDFAALGLAGALGGAQGAAFLGVSPLHALFNQDRERASPYNPSDRRFLDPLLIDVLADDGLPFDASSHADAFGRLSKLDAVDYSAVWARKNQALRARFEAFEAARAGGHEHPAFAEFDRFVAEGGEALRRFAIFEAVSRDRRGEDWRLWPERLRDAVPAALDEAEAQRAREIAFVEFCQWLADRQLAAAAAQARAGGLEIGLYRDLAVGSAPDGAEAWARAGELMSGVSVGAPPDPFSAHGQIWALPAPDPIAGGEDGYRGLAALYGANMRHAGMLRIDHAMGLTRLFVVPDGAKAAEGAYVAYPVDDLIGQIALESQRHACMIVGEDLGTVPKGFRARLAQANIFGMKVLWFERDGAKLREPGDYPALSIACASTHDLPTLVGWRRGGDIGERLMLGLTTLAEAGRQIAERTNDQRALLEALRAAGVLGHEALDLDADTSVALDAAIHAFLAGSGAALASAQFDDLAGEAIATNLPGTDRERPNWRRRHAFDIETLLSRPRAAAILKAIAMGGREGRVSPTSGALSQEPAGAASGARPLPDLA